jgi:small conductance mechanosensitive channel
MNMTNQIEMLNQVKIKAVDLGAQFGPKLLAAVVILIAGFFAARWVAGLFERSLNKFKLEPPVRQLLLRLVRVLVIGVFLLMAVMNLGFEIMPLVAGLGVAGAGVALALQGVLGNLAAGLTIIFTKPFRIGEYIQLIGVEGEVVSVELFATTLIHPDRSHVVIPNRKIVGEVLHNYGKLRQLDLNVGVAYATDLAEAIAAVNEVLNANPRVLKDPAPVVGVNGLGDSAINLNVRPWTSVADYLPAGAEIYRAIVDRFRERQISIPFPQREVRLLQSA